MREDAPHLDGSARSTTYEVAFDAAPEPAWRLLQALEEGLPAPVAVGIVEREGEAWRVWAHYAEAPDVPYLAGLLGAAAGAETFAADRLTVTALPNVDWVAHSQAHLAPVRAGRILVHGSHDRARFAGRRWAIEIDAAQAFGSAHHATTQGCLTALDALLKEGGIAACGLDLGTGSGVLAIALARLGGVPVLASDLDPMAVAIARENARRNAVADRVTVIEADGLAHPALRRAAPFGIVFANILARPLIRLAPGLAKLSAQGARVILSGFSRQHARGVIATYRSAGFTLVRLSCFDGWATVVMCRSRPR